MAACALITGPAVAQSIGEKTGINEVLGITPSTADFVKEAATSDMFELDSSALAEANATDEATKWKPVDHRVIPARGFALEHVPYRQSEVLTLSEINVTFVTLRDLEDGA